MSSLLVVTPPGPECDVLCASLGQAGFTVWAAGSGAEAVGAARRRQPKVILMDPALSAMDRWHAVKRLNTEPATAAIPVLTLASDATSPAGLQRVIAKITKAIGSADRPAIRTESVPPVALRASMPPPRSGIPGVSGVPGTEPPQRPAPPSEPAVTAAPMAQAPSGAARILVVDDNALNRDMLGRRLSRRGYEVGIAEDGQQALDLLHREPYDLILLDWMMPGLSGIDVLKQIRATHSPMDLPVIMATAKTEADDVVEALRAEANDYVTKPLNFDVVNARIQTQLGLMRAHRDLQISEQRYRALLENTGDMIVQYQLDGKLLYVSPASRTLLGFEPAALLQRSLYEWIHPIDRRELEAQQSQQKALPPAYTFIARMQRQDQTYIWVETSCRVTRDARGGVTIQAVCRDVTEHMERLSGDEPPLPLGGDIMAHPGWRGGKSVAPSAAPEAVPVGPVPVVVVTLLDGVDVTTVDRGAHQALAEALATRLRALTGGGDA